MSDLREENLWSLSLDDTDLQTAFDIILDVPLEGFGVSETSLQNIQEAKSDNPLFLEEDDLFNPTELNNYEYEQQARTIKLEENIKPWKEARTSQFQRSGEMTMEKWTWNPASATALDPLAEFKVSEKQEKNFDTSFTLPSIMPNFDDLSSSDDEDGGKGDKTKRRSNVREHSKAQREKRKAVVMDLESTARTLTHQLNEMESLLRSNLEHIAFKRNYFHETVAAFLSAWSSGDDRVETWQSLADRHFTEMILPLTTTRYYPPGQIIGGRRVLRGLNQVIADASSFSLLCSSITSRGNVPISSFTFSTEVSLKNFLVDTDIAFGSFRLFTKSAVLSGGKQEINLKGFMRCGFSTGGNLQWLDLFYDESDLRNQLIFSFGEKVYQGAPNIFQMVTSLHHNNTEREVSDDEPVIIETTLSVDLRVTALSPGAIKKIGSIIGRTLISADWVNSAILTLTEYSPYSCVLDSRTQNDYQSKILCQIYPFSPERIEAAASNFPSSPANNRSSNPPTKLLWIMTEWTSDDQTQIFKVLLCQLTRLLHFSTNALNQLTNRTGRTCPQFSSRIAQLESLTNFEVPQGQPVSIENIVEFMKHFLAWVELIEVDAWSDESVLAKLGGGSIYGKSLPKDNSSGKKVPQTESDFKRSSSSTLAYDYMDSDDEKDGFLPQSFSNSLEEYQDADISLYLLLAAEIDNIFVTIRDSSCCPNIIALLQQTADRDQTQVIETYISYCLTKHINVRIKYLMKLSQELIRAQQLEKAVNVLTEIISLDPTFLEAYNRRATALYGLRRVQECFSDLEYVLKHNPLHYGALCGKGLMLMNLKAYTPAIAAFQTVLHINPKLANSDAILMNIRHCRQYEWQSSHHQMASPASNEF